MRDALQRHIDTIEEAYEFMLAYAAQGLSGEAGSKPGGQLREFLSRAATAMASLGDVFSRLVAEERLAPADQYGRYRDLLVADAQRSLAALELVLAQPSISSQLIDNLNASMHLRALLTDLFLIDEILKAPSAPSALIEGKSVTAS